MQKSKIIIAASLTTVIVGIINSTSAIIAYNLTVPENTHKGQSLIKSSIEGTETALPTPDQNESVNDDENSAQLTSGRTSTGDIVKYRSGTDALGAGEKPQPVSVTTNPEGKKVYQWCSGINPDLPDDVCQAIIDIVANPTESNPHLGTKAKESLSLLPEDSSLTMDERSWKSTGSNSGTMIINANTPNFGDVKLLIILEKQNNIWVVVDGQIA